MNKKTIGLCIGLCALTAFVTAVTVSNNTIPQTNTTAVAETSSSTETTSGGIESETTIELPTLDTDTATSEAYIGEDIAKEIALAHAELSEADVTFAYCKLDNDDGIYEYEVEFYCGTVEYDYDINATTGEIISFDYEMEHSNVSDTQSAPTDTQSTPTDTITSDSYIEEANALEIAFTHAGINEADATNLRCELDYDDGDYEYEIEWKIDRTEYEYTILATDGTILEFDIDVD